MFSALRRWRRRRQADRKTVSTAQWEQVEQSLPFLAWRPAEDRPRLRRLALEFLAEKQVHGARGLEVSDTMLLSIALQACLPVLHIGLDAYTGWIGIHRVCWCWPALSTPTACSVLPFASIRPRKNTQP